MVVFRSITPLFSVSAQIGAGDILKARSQGFLKLINSRPDHEDGVQFRSNEAVSIASQNDLDYAYVPAENHLIYQDETINQFIGELHNQPGPVLAYCKSGTRCAILWALAASRFQPARDVLSHLIASGFEELDILEADMEEQSARYLSADCHNENIPAVFRLPIELVEGEASASSRAA